jgi:hypothetical protein
MCVLPVEPQPTRKSFHLISCLKNLPTASCGRGAYEKSLSRCAVLKSVDLPSESHCGSALAIPDSRSERSKRSSAAFVRISLPRIAHRRLLLGRAYLLHVLTVQIALRATMERCNGSFSY